MLDNTWCAFSPKFLHSGKFQVFAQEVNLRLQVLACNCDEFRARVSCSSLCSPHCCAIFSMWGTQVVALSVSDVHHHDFLTNAKEIGAAPFPNCLPFLFSDLILPDIVFFLDKFT